MGCFTARRGVGYQCARTLAIGTELRLILRMRGIETHYSVAARRAELSIEEASATAVEREPG
jgi:hypothetical protein